MSENKLPEDLLGTWIEDTFDPKEDSEDRYDNAMTLHALVLSCDDEGRSIARYGMIYESSPGTDEEYGEGTFQSAGRRLLVVLPELLDWSNADGMGYDTRRCRVLPEKLDFVRTQRRGVVTLKSHLSSRRPTVPEARFIRAKPAHVDYVLQTLDDLAARARERRSRAGSASPVRSQ
jgi:hypothetical protein